jgi:hypothetical protein
VASSTLTALYAGAMGGGWLRSIARRRTWVFLVPTLVFFVDWQILPVLWMSVTDFHFLRNQRQIVSVFRTSRQRWPIYSCGPVSFVRCRRS